MDNIIKKNIEGTNYEIIEIPATKRSIIAGELKYITTGAASGIVGDVTSVDSDLKVDYLKIATGILDRIGPEKGAYLLRDIIMNGLRFPVMETPEQYDICFTENYHHQIELVAAIMELNFGKIIFEIKKKLLTTGILTLISSKVEEKKAI